MTINNPSQFTPEPGYILLEIVDNDSLFKQPEKADDVMTRIGRILAIGEVYINQFGIEEILNHEVGDIIAYRYQYNNDELDINFVKYPIVPFNMVRGKISE